jgi:transcriptional regulator
VVSACSAVKTDSNAEGRCGIGGIQVGKHGTDLLHGTLDLLILKLLERSPMNGYSIGKKIEVLTDDALRIEEGSLYPALYRMERRGWLKATWGTSENNRKAKFYQLTRTGKKKLAEQAENWNRFQSAVGKIMEGAG